MRPSLFTEIVPAVRIGAAARSEIIGLCATAYGEPFDHLFESLPGSVHVLARLGGRRGELVSHAAWVTRRLGTDRLPPLRSAYVEAVATSPAFQGRGFGTMVMRTLAEAIAREGYDLGALSPSTVAFYERLGWEQWRGPLAIRVADALLPTPEEVVMVLRLPGTPQDLDLHGPLVAEWRPGELW